ncbi:MAG: Tat pathway signal protein, partial [bacterium]|nr:Tat pathway signal protein [bacterium]
GFPLAPMILGVVLGTIAEVNLNRAYMSDPNPIYFFTRPISLFFVIFAAISLIFPFWQRHRAMNWTQLFPAASVAALSLPFWISPGPLKLIGLALLAIGLFMGWRKIRNGPTIPPETAR